MRKLVIITWCLCALAHGAPCFAVTTSAPSFKHTVAIPFGGELSITVAARVSEAMARIGAMEHAAQWLETHQSVKLARLAYEKTDPEILRDAQPLAWALYHSVITGQEQIGKIPSLGVRSTVTAVPAKDINVQIKEALMQPKRLHLYRKALDLEQRLLRQFVHVSGAMPATPTPADTLQKEFEPQLKQLANGLYAISLLRDILHGNKDGLWIDPAPLIPAMNQAIALAPENPLLWYVKGTANYQLQQMQNALNDLSRCIELYPNFAQALHDRGTTYLRIHLTDLAIADFDAAIQLQPRNADYFRSRGSAYLVREDFTAMCRDFYTACSLGECENYHWATSRGHCTLPATVSNATKP